MLVAKTVKIGVDDACAGLETPDGRVFHVNDHVVEVPSDVAPNFLRGNRSDHLHRHRPVGTGWSRRRERALERAFGKE